MKHSLTRAIIPTFAIATILGLTPIHTANAQENTPGIAHNDLKEEKFIETFKTEYYNEWKKTLTHNELESLELLKYYDLNGLLREVNGDIDLIKIDLLDSDEIRKSILTLDKAVMKSKKIEKDIHVYKYLTDKDIDFKLGNLYSKDMTIIDRDKYHLISKDFKYGIFSGYLDPHLTKQESITKGPILLELKIPKGTHVGYLDNNEHILLPRNQGVNITKSHIIVENGKERIKFEAEIIDEKKVMDEIKDKENTINKFFREAIEKGTSNHRENEIPIDTKLVNIVTNSLNASVTVNRAENLLHVLTQNIPSDLLIKTLEQMKHDAPITITDYNWDTADKKFGLNMTKQYEEPLGIYNYRNKQLVLNLSKHEHQVDSLPEILVGLPAPKSGVQTLLHEFGHAVDDLILNNSSQTFGFDQVYKNEKDNIKIEKYMQKNQREFFASAFGYIFSPNPQYQMRIKQEAPKTVEFIQNELKMKGLLKK
ncbi:ADP-ribosyltransferase [Bacillus cereus]